ncbi:MAG: thiolase family protein, partial [Proteobacteria bacterium]|nr:thiolase family protein [Pseudomonadota bacterium]
MSQKNRARIAIVAGGRTPFVKSGKAFNDLGPLKLGNHVVSKLMEKYDIDPDIIEALAYGVTLPEPGKPNLARELVFETGLSKGTEAQTISSYCITGLRTLTAIADAIALGRIEIGIAGGTDSLSHANPNTFQEPSTGLSMGEHTELTRKQWEISRQRQDEIALASHRNAIAAREHLAAEIFPLLGVEHDTGPRSDTSLEALTVLRPVFEESGTLTAGNSSPVSDGASAVLLMSEERARIEGKEPLAFIRDMVYAAIDPVEGLLMAPAITVPRILERNSLKLEQIDLIEMHEAFAAQVLANAKAWEAGWKAQPIGAVDWQRVNVSGSSIAIGHPWCATGGRIVTTLAYEMARRDVRYGL